MNEKIKNKIIGDKIVRIILTMIILVVFLLANTDFSVAWEIGNKSLDKRIEVKGSDFKNPSYNAEKTKYTGNQGKEGKQYEDLGKKGRTYKITKINKHKKIKPILVAYPKYLYLKRTKTYYDLILSVTDVYCNKKEATFTLGRMPEISVSGNFKKKSVAKGTITSLGITQKIRISKGQKNPRKLDKLAYYVGVSHLCNYSAIKYYGKYNEKNIFKPKGISKTACKYYRDKDGYIISSTKKMDEKKENRYKIFLKNNIIKKSADNNIYKYRYGAIKHGGKKSIQLTFWVLQPNLEKEKTIRVINSAIKFAKKYALDDKFHYTNYSSEDKKTQKCPVCMPELQKVKKYCGWNCIGYVSAAFYHAGVKTVECRAGGIVNDGFAEYDKLTEKKFQERNGRDWHLVLKQNKYLPETKLIKGDVLICYSGKTFKHICIYDGNGYIYDAKSSGDNISKRPYSTIGVTPKIAFRYRIDKLN